MRMTSFAKSFEWNVSWSLCWG